MKNDINLLYKRETKALSTKRIAAIIISLIVLAVALYAGITIPSSQLTALRSKAAELDNQLGTTTSIQVELSDKTKQNKLLEVKLEEIKALGDTKSNIIKYINAVESSLPTDANINNIVFSVQSLSINGTAKNDTVISTFCLKLKQQKIFNDVFVASSIALDNVTTTFNITATLPNNLTTDDIINAIEEKDNPTTSPTATPEVSN